MDLDLTPEQELVRSTVREFAEQKVAPVAAELVRKSTNERIIEEMGGTSPGPAADAPRAAAS